MFNGIPGPGGRPGETFFALPVQKPDPQQSGLLPSLGKCRTSSGCPPNEWRAGGAGRASLASGATPARNTTTPRGNRLGSPSRQRISPPDDNASTARPTVPYRPRPAQFCLEAGVAVFADEEVVLPHFW